MTEITTEDSEYTEDQHQLNLTCASRTSATAASISAETSLREAVAFAEPSRRERKKSADRMIGK